MPDPKDWDADYRAYARAKARLSWETGRDGHVVQALEPYRLRAGDTNLWGGVALGGIVVGVSGAQPWFDEAFAGCIAHCLRALAPRAGDAGRAGDLSAAGRGGFTARYKKPAMACRRARRHRCRQAGTVLAASPASTLVATSVWQSGCVRTFARRCR